MILAGNSQPLCKILPENLTYSFCMFAWLSKLSIVPLSSFSLRLYFNGRVCVCVHCVVVQLCSGVC